MTSKEQVADKLEKMAKQRQARHEAEVRRTEEELLILREYLPHGRYLEAIYCFEPYGDASLKFHVPDLGAVRELMGDYVPAPARDAKAGCRFIYPVAYHDKLKERYRDAGWTAIAPFWVKLERLRGYPLQATVAWFTILGHLEGVGLTGERGPDKLVRCSARVFDGKLPEEHTEYRTPGPSWAHLEYKTRTSHGELYVKDVRGWVELVPIPARIMWGRGGNDQPNSFTFYWPGNEDLTIEDVTVSERRRLP